MKRSLSSLNKKIVSCRLCPRLTTWREEVAGTKVRRFQKFEYWGKPVPGFGDHNARVLIVGLAPAAHGANRTGRMFTGDESGAWLYRALHKAGFANQPVSVTRNDGLSLHDCYITAACRCAPPKNKPLPEEIRNCRPYILEELRLLKKLTIIIGLGKIGFDAAFDCCRESGLTSLTRRPTFSHGVSVALNSTLTLIGSYHPSQQNTFTGVLTKRQFDNIFRKAKKYLNR
ncbi:MAG: uracil-DNA glycosylase [Bacteroidota bacterium]